MTNSADCPPSSTLLANRYRVLKILGDGGFGTTFLAEDIQMPSLRKCVVKQLKPISDQPQIHQLVQERFQREAAILEHLGDDHNQIPKLFAYFGEADQFYLVEEWVEGQTLTQMVQQSGPLNEPTVQQLLVNLLPVLDYIHKKQIVHRDIKPDNIILRQRDHQPVLIDFGAVKETMGTVINAQGNSSRSIVIGTPGFMSSEQSAGRPVYSSDLYSLGLTAIYLLTGKTPQALEADPKTGEILWRHQAPQVSALFADILDQAIHLNLRDRFVNAQQMLAALTTAAPTVAPSTPTVVPPVATVVPTPHQPGAAAPTGAATVGVAPASAQPTQAVVPPISEPVVQSGVQTRSKGEWKTAALTGTVIGGFILLAAFVIRAELPRLFNASETTSEASPAATDSKAVSDATQSPSPSPDATSTPVASPPPPTAAPTPTVPTNATVVGTPGSKNIRSGPGTSFGVVTQADSGDRIQVIEGKYNQDNFLWYQVYVPKSGTQGWLASHLTDLDPNVSPPVSRPPRPSPPPPSPKPRPKPTTNATIVGTPGSKNIRRGPGTNFGVQHIAYPGDRVKILTSSQDRGGYLWYRVSFPKSGATGWIAAQLIRVD